MQVFEAKDFSPAFELAPVLFSYDNAFKVKNVDCNGRTAARVPRLLGSGIFNEPRAMAKTARLCVRVEPNGEVTAARVLRSSGSRVIDASIEAHARALVFEPARTGEQQAQSQLPWTS